MKLTGFIFPGRTTQTAPLNNSATQNSSGLTNEMSAENFIGPCTLVDNHFSNGNWH